MTLKKFLIIFYIPLFFVLSLKANYTITKRALPKMRGGTITKTLSFLFYYLGGIPFCMIEFFKQAMEDPHETGSKTGDETDTKHSHKKKP